MKIYLAAPLFSKAEQDFNNIVCGALRNEGYEVFLPQEECKDAEDSVEIFETCEAGLQNSDVVVAILDGADADSGTCWEVGYAYAKNKGIVSVRTDFRRSGDSFGFNAMLLHSSEFVYTGNDYLQRLLDGLRVYSFTKEKAPI